MMRLHQLYPNVKLARVTFSHTEPLVSVEHLKLTIVT